MTSVVLYRSESRNSTVPYGCFRRCDAFVRHPQSGRARREICSFRLVPFRAQERRAEYMRDDSLLLGLGPLTILR
jgi:hypothetical protein